MFIEVKYGENRTALVNPECRNRTLLFHLRTLGLGKRPKYEDAVDVCDESGKPKFLLENMADYGTRYFHDREVVILLKVEREEGKPDRLAYVPLLDGKVEDKEFMKKLNACASRSKNSSPDQDVTDGRSSSRTHSKKIKGERKPLPRRMSRSSASPSKHK